MEYCNDPIWNKNKLDLLTKKNNNNKLDFGIISIGGILYFMKH